MRLMTLAAVAVLGATLALGEEAAAQLKIAVLDRELAIQQSEEYKSFLGALQAEFADEQAELTTLQADIAALQKRITDESDVMSELERRNVSKEIENKNLDFDFKGKKFQKDTYDRNIEFFQGTMPKLQAVVADLIEIERYDFVFERRPLIYANTKHDITAKVTEKLNERYAEQQAGEN